MDYERFTQERLNFKEIGYLSSLFVQGETPEGFLEKLIKAQETIPHTSTVGHHVCEYCFPGGDNEIQTKVARSEIKSDDVMDALSSGDYYMLGEKNYKWPLMLAHYIKEHKYLPPQEFIDSVLSYVPPKPSDNRAPEVKLPEFDF